MKQNNKTNVLVYFIPFYGLYKIIKKDGKVSTNILGLLSSFFIIFIYLSLIGGVIYLLLDRFSYFGTKPLCNLEPERALNINGFVFPLCYRCMSIILSCIIFIIILMMLKPKRNRIILPFCILAILSCLIDGVLQYFLGIESTNFRRCLTGTACGVSVAYFIFFIVNISGNEKVIK